MAMFTNQMRFTGMSGLDVNDMVTQLMRGHSVRLDRLRQNRDVLRWQQDMMRNVSNDIRGFQRQFLDFTANQQRNIRSEANFAGLRATVTTGTGTTATTVNGVTVTANNNLPTGVRNIRIEQTASGDIFRSTTSLNQPIVANRSLTDSFNLYAFQRRSADPANPGQFVVNYASVPNHAGPGNMNSYFNAATIQVTMNGQARSISITASQMQYLYDNHTDIYGNLEASGQESFLTFLNEHLQTAFGVSSSADPSFTGSIYGADSHQHVWADFNAAGHLTVETREGNQVVMSMGTAANANTLDSFGFNSRAAGTFAQIASPPPANQFGTHVFVNGIDANDGFRLALPTETGTHVFTPGAILEGNFNTRLDPANMSITDFFARQNVALNSDGSFEFTINGVDFAFTPFDEGDSNAVPPVPASAATFTVNGQAVWTGPATGAAAENAAPTLQNVMAAINNSAANVRMTFSAATGTFALESRQTGATHGQVDFQGSFFEAIGFGADSNTATREHTAQDAVVYMYMAGQTNAMRFERASNNFSIDGINIRIDPGAFDPALIGEDIQINLQRDTAHTLQVIRDFVEEYNNLIRSIRDLTETRRPRQAGGSGFYMPLTEEQRRAMSDREIELWEEQARRGILHRDDTLRNLTQNLHRAIFMDVELAGGGEINLLHLGIRTHSDLNRFGELQIDEERLERMINERLEDVSELFTNFSTISPNSPANRRTRLENSGIGARVNDILTWELQTDGGIFRRAGLASGPSEQNNAMSRRIAQQDRRIDDMIRDLQRREHRYFAMFGRLEAAMVQGHSQMAFLEQMFWMG